MNISKFVKTFTGESPGNVRPGLHHFLRESDGAIARFHLRVDSGGDGMLVANAAAMARLTPSGVVIAKGLLDGDDSAAIVRRLKKLFRGASAERLASDVAAVAALVERMERPQGGYPILNLADPALAPKTLPLERPLAADVPLCAPFHSTKIMERLRQLGIPHVTFIAGRNCDESHLVRAVERGSDLGLITGVRGRGSELAAGNRINDAAAAGLDHLDVYCFSADEKIHDSLAGEGDHALAVRALAAARKYEICAVAQLALTRATLETIDQTLEAIVGHGIENASIFAVAAESDPQQAMAADELPPAAAIVEESAERLGIRLMWQPTVRFDPSTSLGEQLCRGPRTGGDWAIRVEPDGAVFAPRGPAAPAGNILEDDWETIERSEPFSKYRRRLRSDTRCDTCPGLAICAADCPREPAGWANGISGRRPEVGGR
ncbi:MAG: hypothetical protein JW959_00320 [Pirellulales bacterium]|nr:hypothetical protein [Pirellulales bacterium]